MSLNQRDLQVLSAYLTAGTCAKAGEDLGVTEQAVKNRLMMMRLKARVGTTEQLVYEYSDTLRQLRKGKAA